MCLIGVLIYFVIFDGLLASGCPDQDENLLPWSEPSTWDSNTVSAMFIVYLVMRHISLLHVLLLLLFFFLKIAEN